MPKEHSRRFQYAPGKTTSKSDERLSRSSPTTRGARIADPTSERVTFVYGFDVTGNEVSVFTIGPALQSLARLVDEASRTLHPE